jgi:hypothetical protein
MDDWGEIRLNKIDSGDDFWCLFDEMCDDRSEFLYNRKMFLQAYKDGNLYGLRVDETDEMYKRRARMDKIFCEESWYLLPCFCIVDGRKAIIIWTHTRARKLGFGKKLVELLHIEFAWHPLSDSIGFWEKCNVAMLVDAP